MGYFAKAFRYVKKASKRVFQLLLVLILLVFVANLYVKRKAQNHIYTIAEVPEKPVGLLLGTSRWLRGGRENLYFRYRIDAAAKLYHSGKVQHLIVSGDNSHLSYNEAKEMRNALMERGIPSSAITLDYAGFRTLDSVVRCKAVFLQNEVIIISQKFHTSRALIIARHYDMKAVGVAAQDVSFKYGFKTMLREYLARVKLLIDLYIIHKKPKFLGEPIEIPL